MLFRIEPLPADPLEAGARFFNDVLPQIEGLAASRSQADGLVLVFPVADHTHRSWRLAAVQELARKVAPACLNAVASADEAAIAAAAAYLAGAPGVTGQLLSLDGTGASEVLSSVP